MSASSISVCSFLSKSDRIDRARELAHLRREKGIRPHNKEDYSDGTDLKDENKNTKIDKSVKLDSEDHLHTLEDANECPKCGGEKELKPINNFESSLGRVLILSSNL